jgi:hypothetical protein
MKLAPLRGTLPQYRLAIYDPVDPSDIFDCIGREVPTSDLTITNLCLEYPAVEVILDSEGTPELCWPGAKSGDKDSWIECVQYVGLTTQEIDSIGSLLHMTDRRLYRSPFTPHESRDVGVVYTHAKPYTQFSHDDYYYD